MKELVSKINELCAAFKADAEAQVIKGQQGCRCPCKKGIP